MNDGTNRLILRAYDQYEREVTEGLCQENGQNDDSAEAAKPMQLKSRGDAEWLGSLTDSDFLTDQTS